MLQRYRSSPGQDEVGSKDDSRRSSKDITLYICIGTYRRGEAVLHIPFYGT